MHSNQKKKLYRVFLARMKRKEKNVELRLNCAIQSRVSCKLRVRYIRTNSSLFQEELGSATW